MDVKDDILVVGLMFGMVNWSFAALFYLTAYGLGTALTAFTLLLEDVSFHAPDAVQKTIVINAQYVQEQLKEVVKDEDLSRYIL